MNRRRFLPTSLAVAMTQPLVAGAQKAGGTATIGVLTITPLTEPLQTAIREGLRAHGYVEGRTSASSGEPPMAARIARRLSPTSSSSGGSTSSWPC